eukprot:TRINITY_DN12739_c0_g1_i1.p2 TRINITY_DN12739_c0_g1~~TRINITY_DN12739_c0_g1_i1.p2  ORF type:complete len:143 (+),score=27.07 TRINITY_DN12739_c0_g1_i1:300-728(+)
MWAGADGLLSREKLTKVHWEFMCWRLSLWGRFLLSSNHRYLKEEPWEKGDIAKCFNELKAIINTPDPNSVEYIQKMVKVMLYHASGKTSSDGMTGLSAQQFTALLTEQEAISMIWNTHYSNSTALVGNWEGKLIAAVKQVTF